MSKFKYTESEQQFNNVLNYHAKQLESLVRPDMASSKKLIIESEELLKSLGYNLDELPEVSFTEEKKKIDVLTWDEMCLIAESNISNNSTLETLFTNIELQMNQLTVKQLNEEFNALHKLDKYDVTIIATAGKIYFTKNPMSINYPQWITFGKYSYKQLKWGLYEKSELRDLYVRGIINEELKLVYEEINKEFEDVSDEFIVIMN